MSILGQNTISLSTVLSNPKAPWKERIGCLDTLSSVLEHNPVETLDLLILHVSDIARQLNDLRSAVVNRASYLVKQSAKTAKGINYKQFKAFSTSLFVSNDFLKALGCGNKVINGHATAAFIELFETDNVDYIALERLFLSQRDNKNNNVRERVSMGLCIYIKGRYDQKKDGLEFGHLYFFAEAVDVFMKDASGKVRQWAKRAKAELTRLEKLIKGNIEQMSDVKTMSRSMQLQTTPVKEKEENFITPEKLCEEIIYVIEDGQLGVKEKVAQLKKIGNDDQIRRITFNDLKKLLEVFEHIKHFELRKAIGRVIERAEINPYIGNVLAYVEKEKLDKKMNFRFFVKKALEGSLLDFIEFYMLRNKATALRLLLKRLDSEEYCVILTERPEIEKNLLSIINGNFSKQKNKTFLINNLKLLRFVLKNSTLKIENLKQFFESKSICFLKENDFKLFNQLGLEEEQMNEMTIEDHKEENREMKIQEEEPVCSNNDITKNTQCLIDDMEELKRNVLDNKKNMIKITLDSLIRNWKNQVVDNNRLFSVIKDLLKDISTNQDLDKELITLYSTFLETISTMNGNEFPVDIRVRFFIDLISNNQKAGKNIFKTLVESEFRQTFFFFLLGEVCPKRRPENKEAATLLQLLTAFVCYGRVSQQKDKLYKEIFENTDAISTTLKQLFHNKDIKIRKEVVCLLVEIKIFLGEEVFDVFIDQFEEEQKRLVDVYSYKERE